MADRKFGRLKDNRNHLIRNLLTSLVLYEKLVTTEAKAKTLKSEIDRVITNAKKGGLVSRRYLNSILFDRNAVKKAIEVLVPRYENRTSGYTRVTRLGHRVGDGAMKFQIEFIQEAPKKAEKKAKETKEEIEVEEPAAEAKKSTKKVIKKDES